MKKNDGIKKLRGKGEVQKTIDKKYFIEKLIRYLICRKLMQIFLFQSLKHEEEQKGEKMDWNKQSTKDFFLIKKNVRYRK